MQRNEMNRSDMNRTFGGTWLGYKEDDHIEPVYIEGAISAESGNVLQAAFSEGTRHLYLDDPDIVYELPDSGMYCSNTVLWFKRNATRQWHRGIHDAHCSLCKYGLTPEGPSRSRVDIGYGSTTRQHLTVLWNGNNVTRKAEVLSNRLAVLRNSTGTQRYLIYMGCIVSNSKGKIAKQFRYLEPYISKVMEDV